MNPILLFFGFGILVSLLKIPVSIPKPIFEFISFVILLSIGLKGGVELAHQDIVSLLPQITLVAAIGILLPLLAYPALLRIGGLKKPDAASIAAHYGSVSIGTFAVCVAYLEQLQVNFEAYVPLFVVILEVPAIIIGILLAKGRLKGSSLRQTLTEIVRSQSVALLVGGLLIGWLSNPVKITSIEPLFFGLFSGLLCLFLFEMGSVAGRELTHLRRHGFFLLGFGMTMPLISGFLGAVIGAFAGLTLGGTVVVAVLAASASYIAAPAAMRTSVPEANPALSLGTSLGVTFPFNVIVGIPIYFMLSSWVHTWV